MTVGFPFGAFVVFAFAVAVAEEEELDDEEEEAEGAGIAFAEAEVEAFFTGTGGFANSGLAYCVVHSLAFASCFFLSRR